MNLPNSLTLGRIFLVPLLLVVLLTKPTSPVLGLPGQVIGAAIFALAALTDWLDGYVARRRKQVTTLGQLLDPVADKLLTAAAFIALVQMGAAPAWIVAIIIGRELAVTALRGLAYSRGIIMPSSSLGKAKMSSQVVAILLLILGYGRYRAVFVLGQVALWVVLIASVVSGIDYYRKFVRASAS
jgi:CDP-diacylglycerol--glycerol-3-phosphate 3-phosphatidyltransferase